MERDGITMRSPMCFRVRCLVVFPIGYRGPPRVFRIERVSAFAQAIGIRHDRMAAASERLVQSLMTEVFG